MTKVAIALFLIGLLALSMGMLLKIRLSMKTYPTYAEVCQPLHFVKRFNYYDNRIFAVCGSSTTEPVVREVLSKP